MRRWPQAIAQYEIGHPSVVADARRRAARRAGLELCGSSYDGVSFTAALRSGACAAKCVRAAIGRPDAPTAQAPEPVAAIDRAIPAGMESRA